MHFYRHFQPWKIIQINVRLIMYGRVDKDLKYVYIFMGSVNLHVQLLVLLSCKYIMTRVPLIKAII